MVPLHSLEPGCWAEHLRVAPHVVAKTFVDAVFVVVDRIETMLFMKDFDDFDIALLE